MQSRSKRAKIIERITSHGRVGPASGQRTNDSRSDEGLPRHKPGFPRALSIRTEIVGRHACDEARPAPSIQQEKFRVGPHVARIRGNEKRQVSNQPDTPDVRILLELIRLAEQQELGKANLVNLARQFSSDLSQG